MGLVSWFAQKLGSTGGHIVQQQVKELSYDDHVNAMREEARRVEDIYCGKFKHRVGEWMRAFLAESLWLDLHPFVSDDNNLMCDIVGKLAISASNGVNAALLGEEGAEVEDGGFAAWKRAHSVQTLCESLDDMVRIHPGVLVMPSVVFDRNTGMRKLVAVVKSPSGFNLVHSEHNHALVAALEDFGEIHIDDKEYESKTVWTAEKFEIWARVDERSKWFLHKEGKNPYNVIPGEVFYNKRPLTSVWQHHNFGRMLADQTIRVNAAQTWLDLLMFNQNKVLGGEFKPDTFPSGQVLGPGSVVSFGGDGENYQILDFQTDVARLRETYVLSPRRESAIRCGLAGDEFERGAAVESGFSQLVRYGERDKEAVKVRASIAESMERYYWLSLNVLAVQSTMPEDDGPLKGKVVPIEGFEKLPPFTPSVGIAAQPVRFSLTFNEHVYPVAPAERQAEEDRRLEMAQTNLAEMMMREDPDIVDIAEAEARLRNNQAINRRLGWTSARGGGGLRVSPPVKGQQ